MRTLSLLRAASLALLVAAPTACGGPPPAPTAPVSITGEAPKMPIVVSVEAANAEAEPMLPAVQSSLTTAFATAGWNLVEKQDQAAVRARVMVSAVEKPSMMTMVVNGQRQVTYDVKVDGLFNDLADSKLIDQGSISFVSENGVVDDTSVSNLVAIVTNRGKLVAHSQAVAAAADAEEDKLWEAANVQDCKQATSDEACAGVEAYLAKYEAGRYAADARKALEENKLTAAAQADDRDWAKAKPEACSKPKAFDDCVGVQQYLEAHPTGAHAGDAKGILEKVAPQLEALEKKAEQDAARRNQEDCIKACKRRYIKYAPGAYNILVGRCIQLDCS